MPIKDPEKRREYHRRYMALWYQKNKKKHIAFVRNTTLRTRDELREWLIAIKGELRCEKCGEDHIACLDFHHPDPSAKEFTIASMRRLGISKEKVKHEMSKCIILCANCHRKLHWIERQAKKARK